METDMQNVILETEIKTETKTAAVQTDSQTVSGDTHDISDTKNENNALSGTQNTNTLPTLPAEGLLINTYTDEELQTESDTYERYIAYEHSDSIINSTMPPLFGLGFAVITVLSLASFALFKALGLININKEN